ncbi:MAG: carboxypeptidase-like regulatory domain-containing protein, partial [Bacteroidales bacterium]|nr:carboxypeptidase-like regulatory domain-containing protein [Bacteroidales bacterium]
MKRLSLILASVAAMALSISIYAEPIKIKGKITGTDGHPVIGAFVTVSGDTSNGSVSDVEGFYEITADSGGSLDFSCMGYEGMTEKIQGRNVINVVMREDSQLLDEIVVVGYGTQKKANVTGAVTSIDFADRAEGRPVLSTSAALAGMAPGMSVLQGSGQPGSESATIRIRGTGSFTSGSSSPLVLV